MSSGSETATPVKIVIAGGFAVGKTTLIGAISEIEPVRTEEAMTAASVGVDNAGDATAKTTTTVALDFGRRTLDASLVLYLFGTPGQERFSFLWDDLTSGALGAVVLVDTRRLADCFAAVDYFESRDLPFVVAVNCFDGTAAHDPSAVREALSVPMRVPVLLCDARDAASVRGVLAALVTSAIERVESAAAVG